MSDKPNTDLRIPKVPSDVHDELRVLAQKEIRPIHNMAVVLIKEGLEARKEKERKAA